MVVLKKIKSATLIETLVATVLIVIIFMIASLSLNSVFANTVLNNTNTIENHLHQLEYQTDNQMIPVPYNDSMEDWNIEIEKIEESKTDYLLFTAIHQKTKKTIIRKRVDANR